MVGIVDWVIFLSPLTNQRHDCGPPCSPYPSSLDEFLKPVLMMLHVMFFFLALCYISAARGEDLSPKTSSIPRLATVSASTPCLCTTWSQISPAVAACTSITLDNIHAPASSAIVLTELKVGSTVTFSGTTTFGFTNSSQFRPIQIAGSNVTIQGTPGSIIDGGGEQYWDGLGSNGGRPK